MARIPPTCVLHIGKTGGSFLRSVLRHNEARWQAPLHLLGHGATARSTARRFGETRKLAFVVRNPIDRFVSAFYSRQRQGRPTYNSQWTAEEAAAFLWFNSAEALALALASDEARMTSAASFAFDAIQHLKGDLRFHLGGVEQLLAERDNIAVCVDLAHLNAQLPTIMDRLGVPQYEMPAKPKTHAAPSRLPALSVEAEQALRSYWAEEFEIYEAACDIARGLGLNG